MTKKGFLGSVCVGLLLWIAYATWPTQSTVSTFQKVGMNPVLVRITPEFQVLEIEAQEMRNRLEYMTFPKERKQSQSLLVEILQRQLNINPYDGSVWRELLFLRSDLDSSDVELAEIFSTATTLLKWNERERITLANQCVTHQLGKEILAWKEICHGLLSNLPFGRDVPFLLRNMQVKRESLLAAMRHYGVTSQGLSSK